jgi:hypothetical protein
MARQSLVSKVMWSKFRRSGLFELLPLLQHGDENAARRVAHALMRMPRERGSVDVVCWCTLWDNDGYRCLKTSQRYDYQRTMIHDRSHESRERRFQWNYAQRLDLHRGGNNDREPMNSAKACDPDLNQWTLVKEMNLDVIASPTLPMCTPYEDSTPSLACAMVKSIIRLSMHGRRSLICVNTSLASVLKWLTTWFSL